MKIIIEYKINDTEFLEVQKLQKTLEVSTGFNIEVELKEVSQ